MTKAAMPMIAEILGPELARLAIKMFLSVECWLVEKKINYSHWWRLAPNQEMSRPTAM